MTWHLKDRELENKLIAIDCEFLDNLNDAVNEKIEEFSPGWMEEGDLITLMFCRDHQIELGELYFLFHELEEVPEYNPHAWNEYPKVMPPEYVWMRLEICPDSPVAGRVCAKFKNGEWFLDDGTVENFGDYPARFRPWED